MEQQQADKLSLQVNSLQEGFLTLSKSSSLKDMALNFIRILKKNFLSEEIYIVQKKSISSPWENISNELPDAISILPYLEYSDKIETAYFPDGTAAAVVTLALPDSVYLGIIVMQKPEYFLSEMDKTILKILIQVFEFAYKSSLDRKKEKKLIFELNEKVFQLNNLIDTAIELSGFKNRNILYNLALERASTITNAASAMLRISSPNSPEENYSFPLNADKSLIENSKFRIESSFVYKDRTYSFILSEKEVRGGATLFNDLDHLLLDALTRQLAAAIENDDLQKQALGKKLLEKELAVAASIQQQIIPDVLPKINGYEIAGINIPSKEVGGDYFDCISLKNGKYAFIIADVSGKGISAALLVNTLNAALYTYLEFDLPLTELCGKLNKLIYKASPPDKYITFFMAVLDPSNGELDTINAGHNPILLLRTDGTMEKLEAGGIGLGMLDIGLTFTGIKTKINPGDLLFLYTDGIPEAMNLTEEEYTDDRMISFLKSYTDQTLPSFISALVKDVKIHTGGIPQSDDITSLILKRL